MIKTITKHMSSTDVIAEIYDTIRVGDYGAYVLNLVLDDLESISGDVRLRFERSDGQIILTAPVTVSGNTIIHELTASEIAVVSPLNMWVQFSESNLYTPIQIVFDQVLAVPSGTPIPDTDEYPEYLAAIEAAQEAAEDAAAAASAAEQAILEMGIVVEDQTTPQTFINGIPKLAADRVIDQDNELSDKKYVDEKVATVTADDFDHNDLDGLQGGGATERYHLSAAEKTVVENTSGTNTGDQDVSGAISTHNSDAAAHSNLGIVDAGGYYNATTVDGALQETGQQLVNIKNVYGNRHVRSLATRLITGIMPACIICQGDSTSNGLVHWYHNLISWLSDLYQNYTVKYRLWSSTNEAYGDQQVIKYGAAGDAYVNFENASGRHISAPDTAPLSVTGDIDIRAKVQISATTTGVLPSILTKTQYWLTVSSLASGRFTFYWYNSSFALKSATSEPTSVLAGGDYWIRVSLDVDNGAGGYDVKFWTSVDGATWTQIGTTITGAAPTDIYNGANIVEIGSTSAGTAGYWGGRFYYAEIRSGIAGKIVGCFDAGLAFPSIQKTIVDAEGNTWTINGTATNGNGSPCLLALNASVGGTAIASAAANFALQTKVTPQLFFINFGHNETTKTVYEANVTDHTATIAAAFPECGIVLTTQNPQKASDSNEYEYPIQHAIRTSQIAQAAAKNNYGLIDAYRAFMNSDDWAALINSDGVHPTDAGQLVWTEEAKKFMASIVN